MAIAHEVARIPFEVLSAPTSVTGSNNIIDTCADYAHIGTTSAPPRAPRIQRRHRRRSFRTRSTTGARRIALFTGNFFGVTDGVSRTLQRLVDFLRSNGHRILVVGPSDSRTSLESVPSSYVDVPSIPVPGRPEYRLSMGLPKAVCRRLDEFRADLIHIATPDLLGIGALKWAESRQLPVVATYHTHFPAYLRFYHLGGLEKPVESYYRWFYGRCRHVYVPTPPLAAYFDGLGLRDNVRLWGRGVDCLRFHPRHRNELWRRRHSIGPDEILVAYVGRLVKEKGTDVLESVIRRLHARSPGARTVIVGDGPMRAHLEVRLPNTIFTGHLDGAALSAAYASSDVFLFPSESEAFGNVIVEAMASGLPVVCASASGSSSHVVGNRSGLLAAPGDADAFLKQVLRLIQNREERIMMGFHARRQSESYDWQRTLDQLTRYYDEACTSPDAP